MNKTIAIDASRAFVVDRTGIQEYSYQVIKYLRKPLQNELVVLYVRLSADLRKLSDLEVREWIAREFFDLPKSWRVRVVWWRRMWTQIGLSLAMLRDRPDVLLVLAHTVPIIHPTNTIVVVHGLEYEITPQAYSWWARWYMRMSIWFSVMVSTHVIAVSQNTKRDIVRLYQVSPKKITVIHEGVNIAQNVASGDGGEKFDLIKEKIGEVRYFFFIGRLEERKNVAQIVKAFDEFKSNTGVSDKLVLAGIPSYGFAQIRLAINQSKFRNDIIELGFVSEPQKWYLLKHAYGFVFPTLYEGFGLPVLEAQSVGTPVITSNISSLPEVAGNSALLVSPTDKAQIANAMEKLHKMSDFDYNKIVTAGHTNCRRFDWKKCANEIAQIL